MWKYKHKVFHDNYNEGAKHITEFLNEHPECEPISVTLSCTGTSYILFYKELTPLDENMFHEATDKDCEERNYVLGTADFVYQMQDPGHTSQTYESTVFAPAY